MTQGIGRILVSVFYRFDIETHQEQLTCAASNPDVWFAKSVQKKKQQIKKDIIEALIQ